MALQLDERQRAMLLEMGVRVWLPGTDFATVAGNEQAEQAPALPSRTTSHAPVRAAPVAEQRPPASSVPPASRPSPVQAVPVAAAAPASAPVQPSALAALDWNGLADTAAACESCGLCAGRKHATLQPAQQAQADWMVVGDPPEEDEDSAAQAFVEAPGLLLDNMLKAAGVSRTGQRRAKGRYAQQCGQVPSTPHGRNFPRQADLAQCAAVSVARNGTGPTQSHIWRMGRFATQFRRCCQEHGAGSPHCHWTSSVARVYRYRGIPVVVTYPPQTALLRTSANKAKAWADLCLAMDTLEPPLNASFLQ